MSDEAPTLESLWAQYDALASNPVVQANFARVHGLDKSPRPSTAPDPRDGQARVTAMRGAKQLTAEQVRAALSWTSRK